MIQSDFKCAKREMSGVSLGPATEQYGTREFYSSAVHFCSKILFFERSSCVFIWIVKQPEE